MELNAWALVAVGLVGAATFYLGQHSSRMANSTHDFLLARRAVRSQRNAAAISGEYLSAASFLGIAGVVLKDGADALWYPIGFAAGFLALMLFVAAPLRRSGAYTLPDFMEGRLAASRPIRGFASFVVVLIGVLYLVPQLQGAGLAFATVLPAPVWVGATVVALVVMVNVVAGGMRSITVVQAFQYWLKLFAISLPAFVLGAVFVGGAAGPHSGGLDAQAPPVFPERTTVEIETPVVLQVDEATLLHADGVVNGAPAEGEVFWSAEVSHEVDAGTTLRFDAGAPVPSVEGSVPDNASWLVPGSDGAGGLVGTYSLMLALFLGTMGLPHILVRFYTNPDGKAARRTTVHVLLLLGLFYLFPTMLGALSRMYVPELLVTGETDAAVLLLPSAMLPGVAGQVLAAVIFAGAFAAFLAACSGLVFSVAGVVATDLLPGRVRDFRVASVLTAVIPLALAVALRPTDLTLSIGMAFALAASTFCPLLVLGIWWRGLTARGALLGMLAGGGLVLAAFGLTLAAGYTGGSVPVLVQQPALVSVPVAFLVMIIASKATQRAVPPGVGALMLGMHAPDPLGFVQDREIPRFGRAEERLRFSKRRHDER
ncbi:Sodium:solute symporter family protein [Haloechinothrix alba]|uniref:Sodium:solute symporter family protein n=1 Tax=Haloechinothrix alba TaxID=664784 RepID=A0A238V2C7_9PSEU|nr:cation acetate symporter [Haloechinothrix alba]SNR28398.1 Sodium:solute symporter family protein [Haloechinothrix alba]